MKVKFFPCATKGLNWRIVSEPFVKIQTDLIFGRNKRDRAFIPLVGIRDLRDNDCVSLTKNVKGTNLITIPTPNVNPSAIPLFATIEGGFRGGVRKFNVGGTIVAEAAASAACESAISLAVVLEDNQEIIFQETGRYGTFYHTFFNENGSLAKNKIIREDFEYLHG